jgi:hypothetical protein
VPPSRTAAKLTARPGITSGSMTRIWSRVHLGRQHFGDQRDTPLPIVELQLD